ncbi:MAG: hypothetical protein AAF984_10315 [Verrucomicrobiota bacterium]
MKLDVQSHVSLALKRGYISYLMYSQLRYLNKGQKEQEYFDQLEAMIRYETVQVQGK